MNEIQSNEIKDLAVALAKAQAQLKPAAKDAVNPHFKSHYATLQSVWDAARPALTANGLSVAQTFAETDGNRMSIVTTLLHTSGQWMRGTLTMIPQRSDPQGIGSAITYGRRYALAAILGIVADEDDDGNAASERPASREPAAQRSQAPIGKPVDWRQHVIHFGKNKGVALGELEEKSLVWYINEWQPKPYNGKINSEDSALRHALDRAGKDMFGPANGANGHTAPEAEEVPM